MKPRAVVLALVLVLLAMLGWLGHTQFYWARENIWAGFQGEALSNDFLAAQRLLQRTGHPAACIQGLPARLPAQGDLLILPRRSQPMAPPDAARIAAWVSGGGLLLAEAVPPDPRVTARDSLFAHFGARLAPAEPAPGPVTCDLAGAALQLGLDGRVRIQAHGAEGALVWCGLGRGGALLCTDLGCLDNDRIQAFDHADFLCAVAGQRPGGKVWIVTRVATATAWGWLWEHARALLIALAALGLAALWAAAPRFGPMQPAPDPARRSFLEHLDACGRYQWRAAQGRPLLEASRGAFLRRLDQLHPGWAALEPEPMCQRLARHSGLPPERIQRALHHPCGHPAGFLEAVQTLHLLGKRL
jgi:hypothetical protein